MRPLTVAIALSALAFCPVGCNRSPHEPTASTSSPGGSAAPKPATTALPSAEAQLAGTGHRWLFVADELTPPRVAPDHATCARYRTDPDHQVTVSVCAFSSAQQARTARPVLDAMRLDGQRSWVFERDALLFLVESPMGLPGRPLPPEVTATFDAVVATLRE